MEKIHIVIIADLHSTVLVIKLIMHAFNTILEKIAYSGISVDRLSELPIARLKSFVYALIPNAPAKTSFCVAVGVSYMWM